MHHSSCGFDIVLDQLEQTLMAHTHTHTHTHTHISVVFFTYIICTQSFSPSHPHTLTGREEEGDGGGIECDGD